MAWLWKTWDEYIENVRPVAVHSPGILRLAHTRPWVETECNLWRAVTRLESAANELHKLGFMGADHDRPPHDPALLARAHLLVEEAVYAGEELLLYHKRIAKSEAAYGFLHQNDMLEHWNRYEKTGRVSHEIHQLMRDIRELLDGYHQSVHVEEEFIVRNLDLPPELEEDFRLARNLFSVGFDEVGLLIAGRGLEGVLRKIADVRGINLVTKTKTVPVSEADMHDLIEAMSWVRWKVNKARLITPETKALLHYLRTLRNSRAHPARGNRFQANPRETASIIAETANHLWQQSEMKRARLDSPDVQKTW